MQELPTEDIDAALLGPLAEPYRTLWLGPTDDGVAAMVSLQGTYVTDDDVRRLASHPTLSQLLLSRTRVTIKGLESLFTASLPVPYRLLVLDDTRSQTPTLNDS